MFPKSFQKVLKKKVSKKFQKKSFQKKKSSQKVSKRFPKSFHYILFNIKNQEYQRCFQNDVKMLT